jgi:hypothetical protein
MRQRGVRAGVRATDGLHRVYVETHAYARQQHSQDGVVLYPSRAHARTMHRRALDDLSELNRVLRRERSIAVLHELQQYLRSLPN